MTLYLIRAWVLAVISLPPSTACAELLRVITYPTSAQNIHSYKMPYSGAFQALNGVNYDVSNYYVSKNLELNISGFTAFFFSNDWTVKLDWTLDNGYNSDLYKVQASLLGSIHLIKSYQNQKINLGLHNAFLIGGHVSERACVDELAREFHCGTGLPWTDYVPHRIKNKIGIMINWSIYF